MAMDLSPATWIWLPSQRTLANTFVLFRRTLELAERPARAAGWIAADSRYRLTVNGRRVQWGPAPADPRWPDVDPFDITALLQPGLNVLGVEVLFYGHGEGTWPMGKPGLLLRLEFELPDGRREQVVSDESWQCCLDRAHRPGQYRRWFLRALQEEFDARLHPYGWDTEWFVPDARWRPAMVIPGRADKPSMCAAYDDYLGGSGIPASSEAALRPRQIPPLREVEVPAARLAESGKVAWRCDPSDWFESRVPDAFEAIRQPVAEPLGEGAWRLPAATGSEAAYATFEFAEQIVGWPHFVIEAPEGAVVELMVQESHDPAKAAWLDTHIYAWSRFICREGVNEFEAFDYESLRWLQLHVRNASRPVVLRDVGVRRRIYPWPNEPHVRCGEPALQRLFDASVNTLRNCAQETCVDGMGRERQQYSGDVGHQLHAIRYAFGETRLPARFLRTFSEGLTLDGYFLDCWPAYDRLARVMQRQVGATIWGPLLDHGVGFVFDCWNHYLETGDLEALREPYPRLLRFADYLRGLCGKDGLLPVEGIGVPAVWIDHDAYRQQRHKQCGFNLYAAAMLQHALAPIARAFGDPKASRFAAWGRKIQRAAIRTFWSAEPGLFINNLPWLDEDGGPRLCDRSLATAVLFGQCPGGRAEAALRALADCPPEMGLSYPANAGWRLWALAKGRRIDVVLRELRERWATLRSVVENNTLQESWRAEPDTADQWSHCPVAPLYVLFMSIAGIRPTAPGFARCEIRPQLGDLGRLELTAHTVRGPIRLEAQRVEAGHEVTLAVPSEVSAELLLPAAPTPKPKRLLPDHPLGLQRFRLPAGETRLVIAQ